jgi:glucokinase
VILAGDIGGTDARLALFQGGASAPFLVAVETSASREHGGPEEIVLEFRERHGQRLEAAVLGSRARRWRDASRPRTWTAFIVELPRAVDLTVS